MKANSAHLEQNSLFDRFSFYLSLRTVRNTICSGRSPSLPRDSTTLYLIQKRALIYNQTVLSEGLHAQGSKCTESQMKGPWTDS